MEALARALVALSAGALAGRQHLNELEPPRRAALPTKAQRSTPASSPAERALSAACSRRARLRSPPASPRSASPRAALRRAALYAALCRAAAAPPLRSSEDRMGPPQSQKVRRVAAAATFDPELRACRRLTRAPSQPAGSADRSACTVVAAVRLA